MPTKGIEPSHPCEWQILSLLRLPIPPHGQSLKPINFSTFHLVTLSTYQLVNLSTYQPINLSPCQPFNLSTFQPGCNITSSIQSLQNTLYIFFLEVVCFNFKQCVIAGTFVVTFNNIFYFFIQICFNVIDGSC